MPYFKEWQEQEKETGLQITNRPSPQCVQMVLDREAQLAVVNNYDELMADPQLEVIELAPMRDVFVGGPAYANAGEFDEERLLQEPLLLLSQGAASRTFFDEITNHRCKKPAFELGSLDVLLDLVEINMGISLVPDMLLKNRLKEGKVVEIKTNIVVPERKTVLVRSRLTPISRAASKFIDLLVK